MNVRQSIRRAAISAAGLATLLIVATGTVFAATTLTLDPDVARPGTRVTIRNACLGVTSNPADHLAVAFVSLARPNLQPPDPAVPRSVARATTTDSYVVVVPKLPPGKYDIRLECLPGDWRTNTAEGGAIILTVRPDLPTTSTLEAPAGQSQPTNEPGRLLIVALAAAGGIATFRSSVAGRIPGTARGRRS
jgi:hypothetical protein